jgi:two-component system, NarL family, response regulator
MRVLWNERAVRREALLEVIKRKTNEEIASALSIAPGTVKTHVNHLLTKLCVADRT